MLHCTCDMKATTYRSKRLYTHKREQFRPHLGTCMCMYVCVYLYMYVCHVHLRYMYEKVILFIFVFLLFSHSFLHHFSDLTHEIVSYCLCSGLVLLLLLLLLLLLPLF